MNEAIASILVLLATLAPSATPRAERTFHARIVAAPGRGPDEDACSALLTFRAVTITYTSLISASANTPAYCYVIGSIGGRIRFDMQLPVRSAWNGRLVNLGGSGKDGYVKLSPSDPRANRTRVANGYAVASNNSGHDEGSQPNASFGENHDAVIDFGYRAVHLTAVASKAVTKAFYGNAAKYSYFEGCSTGGRQGLMEAQRFPEDFDGIVAGDPVFDYQALNASHLWTLQLLFKDHFAGNLAFDKDGDRIPESLTKLHMLQDAVLAKCDARDGIRDSIIDDPLACDFKPAVDLATKMCPGDVDADSCFTNRQLRTIEEIYRGPHDSKGRRVIKGLPLGSEAGWAFALVPHQGNGMIPGYLGVSGDHMNYLFYERSPGDPPAVLNDPSLALDTRATHKEYAWWEFNIDDVTAGKASAMAAILDAKDPDLTRFLERRHGKLLIYHGWADPTAQPEPLVDYYKAVVARTFNGSDKAAQQSVRLFMVPGMGHCGSGPGCDVWDRLAPLVAWVEQGRAPEYIAAEHRTNNLVDNQRRLCPYPQHAAYIGPAAGQNVRANWIEKNFECR